MARAKIDRLFLVEKTSWTVRDVDSHKGTLPHLAKMTRPHDGRKGYILIYTYEPQEGAHPVKAFLEVDKAEAFCQEQEAEAWDGLNPFRYGSREDWTDLAAGPLRDRLLDIGHAPPLGKFDAARWRKWYDVASAGVTELQELEVRQALDRLHFFRVTELTA